ncbi:MAG: hypothetical protein HY929_04825 [Euryarchaeota archaeon]|nr:hypothetical protein [Euryarchaeota archaeon]
MLSKSGLKAGLMIGIIITLTLSIVNMFTLGPTLVKVISPLLPQLIFQNQIFIRIIVIFIPASLIWGLIFEIASKYIPLRSTIGKGCVYAFIWWTIFGLAPQLAIIWSKIGTIFPSRLAANLIFSLVLWIFAGLILGALYSYFSQSTQRPASNRLQ